MNEVKIDPTLLNSLLQFDESLRSGNLVETQVISPDAELLERLETGRAALVELEAAIPRRTSVMPSWAPERIGRFEIQSVLGSGGFAVVYLAFDPALNRNVALKIPRPHALMKPELRRRFVLEAQAAAKLDHPNIVPVHEAGEDRDLPYIACAYCEGPTLAQWLASRSAPMQPKLAAEIVRELARAVQFSHDRGILHRDIKPGNVLLFPQTDCTDNAFPFVPRLGDFGLAKLLESGELDTVTSQLIGTPRYMAPEVIKGTGRSGDVSPDIYALGAVLYCLILGQAPFGSASPAETLRKIIDSDAIPPYFVDPTIGKDLSLICMKCLQKTPEARYLSAAELSEELQRYISGEPVKARATPVSLRVQKWCQRRPGIAALLGMTIALTVALIAFTIRYTISLRHLQSELITTNSKLSEHIKELDQAVQTSNQFQAEAISNRRNADEQVFAADLNLAQSLIQSGDIFGAQKVLQRYSVADGNSYRRQQPEINGHKSFAWRYLMNRTTRRGIPGHKHGQIIWDSQLSPAGDRLAVTGNRGIVRIMDPRNDFGVLVEREVAKTEFNCLSWCTVEPILAVAGDDGLIRICRTDDLQTIRTLEISPGTHLYVMSFQPGATKIVVRSDSNELQIWDALTGERTGLLPTSHAEEVKHLAISPDGSNVVTGSWNREGKICCQDFHTGSVVWEQNVTGDLSGFISIVRYTPDQKYVVVAAMKKSVVLLDAKSGQELRRWNGLDRIHALAADNSRIICGNELGLLTELQIEGNVSLWQPLRQWQGHTAKISSITLLPDSYGQSSRDDVVSTDRSEVEFRWPVGGATNSKVFRANEPEPYEHNRDAVRWKDDRTVFRVLPTAIESIDLTNGSIESLYAGESVIARMEYCDEKDQLLLCDKAGTFRILGDDGHEISQISVWPEFGCNHFSINESGTMALVGSSGPSDIVIVDLNSQSTLIKLTNREWSCLSPDGRWLASASQQQDCYEIYDTKTQHKVAILSELDPTYETCVFTPDSKKLVSVGSRRTVTVWECDTWNLRYRFAVSSSSLRLPCFHPDGRTLAVAANDGEIRLVDVEVGRELIIIGPLPDRQLSGLAFSPDGTQLAACEGNLNLHVVSVPNDWF